MPICKLENLEMDLLVMLILIMLMICIEVEYMGFLKLIKNLFG
jgi:hypothetical protein